MYWAKAALKESVFFRFFLRSGKASASLWINYRLTLNMIKCVKPNLNYPNFYILNGMIEIGRRK